MFSLGRSSSSSNSGGGDTTPAPAPPSSPKFPIYLLPTFSIPFRRRRQSSTISYASSSSPKSDDAVPSLSSTPTSSVLSSPIEGSPPTPSLFPTRPTTNKTIALSELESEGEEQHRRRRSSVEPLDLSAAAAPAKLMQTQPDTIRCSTCAADFAFCSQIVSKGFTGRYGRAYLVSPPSPPSGHHHGVAAAAAAGELVNIRVGKPETRVLVTGSHIVADLTCAICHVKVGWKYVDAKEEAQKYKVGKYILETQRCVDYRSWEDVPAAARPEVAARRTDPLAAAVAPRPEKKGGGAAAPEEETIVFDSDDEDECEDIFSGTWDPVIVAKRRSRKVNQRSKKG